jgi:cell division inhibitor SulA
MTFRAVEALVGTWSSQSNRATRNQDLGQFAAALISEAEYKLNQELAYTVALQTPLQAKLQELRQDLTRAKAVGESQPGTAVSVVLPILRELDRIAQGRADALRTE